ATVSENESFSLTSFEEDFKFSSEASPPSPKAISASSSPIIPPQRYRTEEEIILRPFTHESVVAMEIDEDSNITFLKDPMEVVVGGTCIHEEEKKESKETTHREIMTAMPVKVLEDEEESDDDLGGHFEDRPERTKQKPLNKSFFRCNSIENDGRIIPEPSAILSKTHRIVCKSEDFPKKLKRSQERQGSRQESEEGKEDEAPLVRRNSIHNVPYVDVNDPGTRERMERYKEERRSLLRAKYKAEDYRVPLSNNANNTSSTTNSSNSTSFKKVNTPESQLNNNSHIGPTLEDTKNQKNNMNNNNYSSTNNHNPLNSSPTKSKPPLSPTKSSAASFGLINEEVNVKERAAIFGSRSMESKEFKRKSLPPPPASSSSNNNNLRLVPTRSRSSHSGHLDKSPVSPNKIKNIAALFEQKS
ncbi:Uncharacterized protein FKW44_015870, partial [Caligus rogercresseyi]